MTLAAFDLQNSDEKVIDIALKYGYESPESFTRAFKEMHGIPPSSVRKHGSPLKAFPRITFLLSLKGDTVMEYRIENKEAFTIYGIEGIFTIEDGKNLKDLPIFLQECLADGRIKKLIESTNEPLSCIYGLDDYRRTPDGNSFHSFPHMIGAYWTEKCNTDGFTKVEVPAATWAVFKSEQHEKPIRENHISEQASAVVQNLIKRVYTEWLPTAAYEKIHGYEHQLYFVSDVGECYTEMWIRVKPK